jgi:hypothetical protein
MNKGSSTGLLKGEELAFTERHLPAALLPDAEINEQYVRGEIRPPPSRPVTRSLPPRLW